MEAFRFVHAADVHLDSPLRTLAMRDPALADLVGNATRQALVRVVDLCLDERVDALVLAGDLYDSSQTSMKTARFLASEIRRLHEAGIRTFIVRGNHDALSVITKTPELVFPGTVSTFGAVADAIHFDRAGSTPVHIHGLSFAMPHAPECLLAHYRPRVDGSINIGILHTSLAGAEGHDPYAPCRTSDLHATGFDYWALGHIHRRSVDHGNAAVVMAGIPQGRDINEDGPKGVTLVTIAENGKMHIEERVTCIAQFERVEVDVGGLDDWSDLPDAIERALGPVRDRTSADQLVARLRLVGATPLSWRLRRDADLVRTQAEERAAALGATWIEKLDIASSPASELAAAGDPLAELKQLVDDGVLGSPSFEQDLKDLLRELRGQLPPECRDTLGTDAASTAAFAAELAAEGAHDVLATLQAKG